MKTNFKSLLVIENETEEQLDASRIWFPSQGPFEIAFASVEKLGPKAKTTVEIQLVSKEKVTLDSLPESLQFSWREGTSPFGKPISELSIPVFTSNFSPQ